MQLEAKILIVDDESRIINSLSSLLKKHGYEIFTASDGDKAMKLAHETNFDLCLLDLFLPDTTGQKIMEKIHALSPDTLAIIMTGNASINTAVEALKKGAYDYLRKPFESDELVKTIENALAKKQLEIENMAIQQKLEGSRQDYQYLVDNSPDIIYMLDDKDCFTFINPSIQGLTGLKPDDIIGQHYSALIDQEEKERHQWIFNERRTGERARHWHEIDLLRFSDSGTQKHHSLHTEIQSTGIYRTNENAVAEYVGTHGIIRDITQKKLAAKKKQELENQLRRAEKMEVVGTLASGVAHDLNNLLSSLLAYPELILMDMPDNDPFRDYIIQIKNSGEKATVIVKDLLTLARRRVPTSDIINLDNLVKDLFTSSELIELKACYPNLGFNISLNCDKEQIQGSFVHLSKSIMNLLYNAAEAITGSGQITIMTQLCDLRHGSLISPEMEEGEYIKLSISDNGIGIPREAIKKIFDPFYTRKQMGQSGTGLGMTIVWTTVQDHNGYIDVKSIEGEGTKISMYFPATQQTAKIADQVEIKDLQGNGEHILVMDDMSDQRTIATKMLSALGYKTAAVATGQEGIAYMQEHPVDMVLLDMVMEGGMDGLDIYKLIKETTPDQKVIIVSGLPETDSIKEALELGVLRYIQKPYTINKIGLAVIEELNNTKAAKEL